MKIGIFLILFSMTLIACSESETSFENRNDFILICPSLPLTTDFLDNISVFTDDSFDVICDIRSDGEKNKGDANLLLLDPEINSG